MPLREGDFDRKFVLVKEGDTVAAALERLKAQDGGDNWHIFVALGPGKFGLLRVGELKRQLELIGPALFDLTFADLQALMHEPRVVQQEAVGIGTAERWAYGSPDGVLVVMRGDEVVGRLHVATKRGAETFPGSTMGQLYGDYISTSPDARARWRPAGVEPPTCPHCGHKGFYRYRAEDGAYYCAKCGETIS